MYLNASINDRLINQYIFVQCTFKGDAWFIPITLKLNFRTVIQLRLNLIFFFIKYEGHPIKSETDFKI